MMTHGKIRVSEEIEGMGQIEDIDGELWDIISVWPGGNHVTAAKTKEVSNVYSRWHPFEVEIVK